MDPQTVGAIGCLLFSGVFLGGIGMMMALIVSEHSPFGKLASFWTGVCLSGVLLLVLGLIALAVAHVRWQ